MLINWEYLPYKHQIYKHLKASTDICTCSLAPASESLKKGLSGKCILDCIAGRACHSNKYHNLFQASHKLCWTSKNHQLPGWHGKLVLKLMLVPGKKNIYQNKIYNSQYNSCQRYYKVIFESIMGAQVTPSMKGLSIPQPTNSRTVILFEVEQLVQAYVGCRIFASSPLFGAPSFSSLPLDGAVSTFSRYRAAWHLTVIVPSCCRPSLSRVELGLRAQLTSSAVKLKVCE